MSAQHPPSRGFLSFLSAWDQDEATVLSATSALAGCRVRFSGRPPPTEAGGLFGIFERQPLDAVTQTEEGGWVIPYNPWSAYRSIVEERYLPDLGPPAHSKLPFNYQRVPGWLRLALYPLVAGGRGNEDSIEVVQPKWPIEARVDDYRIGLYQALHEGGDSKEEESGWPGGAQYPLLMTHDIDTREGMKRAGAVLDDMVAIGLKPCFFLVGQGYDWDPGFCSAVRQAGGEIALHGDTHDNRIAYETPERIAARLDSCRDIVEEQQIRGFRAPSLLVSDNLYSQLRDRFEWDSSVPDTDRDTLVGPRRGCGTVFPFHRAGTLVLPTTMPADDRLLLLGMRGLDLLDVLRRKWKHVRQVGGLCHFLTHPEPHLFGKQVLRDLYRALLEEILAEGDAWITTPSELATHWETLTSESEP